MKTLRQLYAGAKSTKINNQNGDSEDEARFIDKQISPAPPMDKTGNPTKNVQAATGQVQPNTLTGKNTEVSPGGTYESTELDEWDNDFAQRRKAIYAGIRSNRKKKNSEIEKKEPEKDKNEDTVSIDEFMDMLYEGAEYEPELIDEISKDLARRYVAGVDKDYDSLERYATDAYPGERQLMQNLGMHKEVKKQDKKFDNRTKGLKRAGKILAKEGEEVTEGAGPSPDQIRKGTHRAFGKLGQDYGGTYKGGKLTTNDGNVTVTSRLLRASNGEAALMFQGKHKSGKTAEGIDYHHVMKELGVNRLKESEEVTEISKGLIKQYLKKASNDLHNGNPDGGPLKPWNHADTDEEGERFRKRNTGIGMARGKTGHFSEPKAKVMAVEGELVEEFHINAKAASYDKSAETWNIQSRKYKIKAASNKHALNKALQKIQTEFPSHKEHEVELVRPTRIKE